MMRKRKNQNKQNPKVPQIPVEHAYRIPSLDPRFHENSKRTLAIGQGCRVSFMGRPIDLAGEVTGDAASDIERVPPDVRRWIYENSLLLVNAALDDGITPHAARAIFALSAAWMDALPAAAVEEIEVAQDECDWDDEVESPTTDLPVVAANKNFGVN